MNRPSRLRSPRGLIVIGAIVLSALACTVTLISKYDEQIDRSATTLQKEMDGFLTGLEASPQPSYVNSKGFYDNYAVELRSVLIRAQSHPKNSQTEQQLSLMMDSLNQLQVVHQAGPVDSSVVDTMRDMFNQSWRAIITLEMAKKRGD